MGEKRMHPRIPIHMELSITNLMKQDSSGIHNLCSAIEITDLSYGGVGFRSQCVLPEGYYFEANLVFEDEKQSFHTLIKIIRSRAYTRDIYEYGCILQSATEELKSLIASYL